MYAVPSVAPARPVRPASFNAIHCAESSASTRHALHHRTGHTLNPAYLNRGHSLESCTDAVRVVLETRGHVIIDHRLDRGDVKAAAMASRHT